MTKGLVIDGVIKKGGVTFTIRVGKDEQTFTQRLSTEIWIPDKIYLNALANALKYVGEMLEKQIKHGQPFANEINDTQSFGIGREGNVIWE